MKKLFYALCAILMPVFISCTEQPGAGGESYGSQVEVRFSYTFDTSNGSDMSRTVISNEEIFSEFYEEIESGELLAPTYTLTFTNIDNGVAYVFNGTWKDETIVTIRTGRYRVTGYSSAGDAAIQNKCSICFDEQVEVSNESTVITLTAIYDCSLLIFNDSKVETMLNFDGEESLPFFSFGSYRYAFVKSCLYKPESGEDAYITGQYQNGEEFQILTGNLNFTKGKYYVYNNVGRELNLNIPPMEEGEGEGNENEGTGNEGETVTQTLDGKQWLVIIPAEESANGEEFGYCFDFGVTVEGKYVESNITFNIDSPAYYKFTPDATMYPGDYTIEPADATSGTIVVVSPMWGKYEYLYKELTATSVKIQKMSYDWAAGPDDYAIYNIPEITITVQE